MGLHDTATRISEIGNTKRRIMIPISLRGKSVFGKLKNSDD
jgi:hypothetical protein